MAHVRCRVCGARRTLSKHPDSYARKPPRCRGGGCKSTSYRVDKYRQTYEVGPKAPKPCIPGNTGCRGYSFPHRHGSGFCCFNPKLTDEQLQHREERGRWA